MKVMEPQVIWITGASSGIGLALCKQYLEQGHRVIASARRQGALSELMAHYERLSFVAFDVTNSEQITSVKANLLQLTDHLDCVILNAGTCEYFDVASAQPDWQMMERMMAVNFIGMVNSIQLSLGLLQGAKRPHLVGVSSQAVQAAFPQAQAYGASKAAMRYFLSSLRIDLKPLNIDVSCILPGFVDTALTQKNDFPMPFLMTTEQAAQKMIHAIAARKYEYAFPKRLSMMLWLGRHFPRLWLRCLAPPASSVKREFPRDKSF